ncbi:MAG: acetylmannosamine-6-phosphate 2-epimerase [Candidatus Synechococcus spongiarum 15L]|uniref:N-acylglucosamine-6-phosphate 2-epimerase n=3 Tax=Candidatus Synechococcus spongiarum TaxID=431041 RepID=A0A1T1D3Q0_9SYNE|nr:N-acetylmannosamine-6-phosphate 2-epimerase [Candidatus Synechococcus spongiarum]KKZ13519.1 MAG: acetylmannosamine-6-phosphate 2-epimerase [Candidatus Synechococcus spongiarum 15L]MCY4359561.1 N-acetylmannosamine-6-phosphate 2-epimerase [Cyanobacteria bacterium MAG APA_bin_95]OOV35495.1 acetylmannosamine-6-phosphate 2-epimerase [Candidatus Synechococcus spongiarum LMB bulk15M]OOV35715.1 acetylmannosamine-6-phosphate 2-epimerase [Candidatus Synechococcus spongiarum LMB bulk15N]
MSTSRISRKCPDGGLIVSVQAPRDSPCRATEVITAMAAASMANGAAGVRLDSPEHVAAVRRRCPEALIIGLWKRFHLDSPVVITPRYEDLVAIRLAGADVVALDATDRSRPEGESLETTVARAKAELAATLMADIDTLANAERAVALGCDWVGTTLYGYTQATANQQPPGLELLKPLRRRLSVPVLCEGGIASPRQARQAMALGATAVVVGTAVTGIDQQVSRYSQALATCRGAARGGGQGPG